MIILKNDLVVEIEKLGIIPIPFSEARIMEEIVIDATDVQGFINLMADLKCSHIFYNFKYYDKQDYIIPLEYYSDYPVNFKNLVEENNKAVRNLNFDRACHLSLHCFNSSATLSYYVSDEWLSELGHDGMDDKMDKLESSFFAVSKEIKSKEKEIKKSLLNDLRALILDDDTFKLKKNKASRFIYLRNLLEEDNLRKYSELFNNKDDIDVFLDETWILLKK